MFLYFPKKKKKKNLCFKKLVHETEIQVNKKCVTKR